MRLVIKIRVLALGMGMMALCHAHRLCAADLVLPISFQNPQDGNTSSGIFDANGNLVRTLSRKVHLAAGIQKTVWDYKDDYGTLVPAGNYSFRVLSNNMTYTWEGLIGNTSSADYGPQVWRPLQGFTDFTSVGNELYASTGYSEGSCYIDGMDIRNPRVVNDTSFPCPGGSAWQSASDGTYLYTISHGINFPGTQTSFVYAMNLATKLPLIFPHGVDPQNNLKVCATTDSAGSVGCHVMTSISMIVNGQHVFGDPGTYAVNPQTWPSPHPMTGLAVQRQGNVLAVAMADLNQIVLYDKRGGQQTGVITTPSPSYMTMDADGNLYVISGSTLQRFIHVTGTGAQLDSSFDATANLIHPLSVAVSTLDPLRVVVTDGGSSQQVKGLDTTGHLLWTLGQAGGVGTDPSITNDRFGFVLPTAGPYLWVGLDRAPLAILPDGSFWFYSGIDSVMLHYAIVGSTPKFIEQINFLPINYHVQANQTDPTQIFAWGFMEYKIDYSKTLDRGQNGSWKLVKNWAHGTPHSYFAHVPGFLSPATLSNGRTYALVPRSDVTDNNNALKEVVELPATGPFRPTGILLDPAKAHGISIYPDGSLRYSTLVRTDGGLDGSLTVYSQDLIGFTGGNPQWGPAHVLSCGTATLNDPFSPYSFTAYGARFPNTSSGMVINLGGGNPTYGLPAGVLHPFGMHLGGMKPGSQCAWSWRASPGVQHEEPMDGLGSYDDIAIPTYGEAGLDGVNYSAGYPSTVSHNVFYNYFGESYHQGEANQYMHFYEDGLFVGQFGVPPFVWLTGGEGATNNSRSAEFVQPKVGGPIYMYLNDEGITDAIDRWRIDGADNIKEASVSLGHITPPIPPALDITFTQQPVSQEIALGAAATFVVGVNPPTGTSYQWLKNGAAIAGATKASYTTAPIPTPKDDGSQYSCLVWDASGSTTSVVASLSFNPRAFAAIGFQPTLYTTQVGDASVTLGIHMTRNVYVAQPLIPAFVDYRSQDGSAVAGRDYQAVSGTLQFNPGESDKTVTIPLPPNSRGGFFQLQLSNAVNSVLPGNLMAIVQMPANPVTPTLQIIRNPENQQVNAGLTALFAVGVTPGFPVTYQWYENGRPIMNSNAASFITPATTASDNNAVLACTVSDGQTLLESTPATLSVIGNVGSIGSTPSQISARVYPNPWRSSKHESYPVTFDQLVDHAQVKIFTVSGHHVKTLTAVGSKATWDLTNESGQDVASGIYLFVALDPQGDKNRGTFSVVR